MRVCAGVELLLLCSCDTVRQHGLGTNTGNMRLVVLSCYGGLGQAAVAWHRHAAAAQP